MAILMGRVEHTDKIMLWARIIIFCIMVGVELCSCSCNSEVCPRDQKTDSSKSWQKSQTLSRHRRRADLDLVPYFDNSTSRNVTTTSGKTAYLPCRVKHLGERTVSWIRRKDLHVLTVGSYTYTSDQRFTTIHLKNSDDWTLQVKYPQSKDGGVYECQVSTVPKMSHFVTLNVIESKAKIKGGPTLYINSGSTINLTCQVMESPVPPDYVFWYHNGKVINYDSPRGISVHTETAQRTTSKLLISNAQPSDSGNYSCVPSNAEPAAIGLHVLNGENPAAMQHGKHTSSGSGLPRSWNVIITVVINFALLFYIKR